MYVYNQFSFRTKDFVCGGRGEDKTYTCTQGRISKNLLARNLKNNFKFQILKYTTNYGRNS